MHRSLGLWTHIGLEERERERKVWGLRRAWGRRLCRVCLGCWGTWEPSRNMQSPRPLDRPWRGGSGGTDKIASGFPVLSTVELVKCHDGAWTVESLSVFI